MQKKANSSKLVYLELLRIIAIFAVLYIHTGVRGKLHYTIAGMSASYYISLILFSLAQICNMLFLMISGALLLHREENMKQTMKRLGRMVITVIVFSLFQFFWTYLQIPEMGFDVLLGLKIMYCQPIISQYWYLYLYLGFLIIMPFLRVLAKHMEDIHYYYLFGICVLVDGILPIVNRLWENDSLNIKIPVNTMMIIYPLLGHFIAYRGEKVLQSRKNLLIINIAAIVALMINVAEANLAYQTNGDTEYSLQGLVFVYVLAIFVDVKKLCDTVTLPQWLQKLCLFVGNGVFGVYLFERQIKDNLVFIYDAVEPVATWVVAVFCWLLVSVVIGAIVTNILKKIAVFRKLL